MVSAGCPRVVVAAVAVAEVAAVAVMVMVMAVVVPSIKTCPAAWVCANDLHGSLPELPGRLARQLRVDCPRVRWALGTARNGAVLATKGSGNTGLRQCRTAPLILFIIFGANDLAAPVPGGNTCH